MPTQERKQSNPPKHPTASQLSVFSEGKGADSFRAAVAKHLQSCHECDELLKSIQDANKPNAKKAQVSKAQDYKPEAIETEFTPAIRSAPLVAKSNGPELIDHPQYAVEREIGRGGMGIVYLVKHKLTGRHEALKVLMPSLVARDDIRVRFLREIQSAASLDHPNICRTLNAISDGDVLGLVMEYLPGSDLAQFVRKHGPIPVRTACSLAIQLCAGLQHAHEKGMIHRDIKPANLMVDRTPNGLRLKILDFGLARGIMDESSDQKSLTVDGRVLGTPEFMSPEQALTPSNVDIRSDLYSVGCVLYFMLTGNPPFHGETMLGILQSHLSKQAIPLTAINPEIPESLWNVVARLLEKDRSQRPDSPADVVRLLNPFLTSTPATPALPTNLPAIPRTQSNDIKPDSTVEHFQFAPRRPVRKQKQTSLLAQWLPIFLPSLLTLGLGYYFQDRIFTALNGRGEPNTSQIIVEQMPDDYEIWIDGQKTSFTRPNANSPAQVTALPGSYKLTLKRFGETKLEKDIRVIAGRDFRIVVELSTETTSKTTTNPKPPEKQEPKERTVDEPREPKRAVFPTAEEIQVAMEEARKALRIRDGNAANAALASLVNESRELKVRDFQPESKPLRQLQTFASALLEFKQRLANSIAKRQPNESAYVGLVRYTFLGATLNEVTLKRDEEEIRLKTDELPIEIEQYLVDLELDFEPQYGGLVKAVGVLTHPKKTQSDFDQARKWIQSAAKARVVTDQFETLANEFANVSAETISEPAQKQRLHTLQRRLSGAEGEIEELFLLPPNVPIPKQTSLVASVLSVRMRGSAVAPFWNINSGEIGQHKTITSPLWACEVSGNGRFMLTFGETSPQTNIRIYALPLTNPMLQFSDLDDERSAIMLSADSRTLAACSVEEMFIRRNLQSNSVMNKIVSKAPVGREKVAAIAIRPTMDMVAVAAKDGSLRIWRTADGDESSIAKDIPISVRAMRFNRRGDRLVVVRENGIVELRELGLKVLTTFRAHTTNITSLGFSAKGQHLVTADCYNNVRVWETDDLKITAAFSVDDSSEITAVTADTEGDLIAIGRKDSAIELWRKK